MYTCCLYIFGLEENLHCFLTIQVYELYVGTDRSRILAAGPEMDLISG